MALFEPAIAFVLENEGGLENDPNDPGGLTKYGIDQRSNSGVDVRNLTREGATEIYRQKFRLEGITDQNLTNKIFDMQVNMGPGSANRLVQRALNIPQDGIIGSETTKLLNASDPVKLLLEIKARQCEFYARIVTRNPSQVEFLLGWLRRAVKP